ncbi:MAG: hypothetical protein IJA94_06440 [Bacilli bacterium]|nr:hypothetical protein [Bacilli bacterium]
MNIETMKTIFNQNGVVRFKMYGLDYTVEKVENGVVIYADLYNNKKNVYENLDDVLSNYYIYNESIESNEGRIQNIH